jgi:hypothetical protein
MFYGYGSDTTWDKDLTHGSGKLYIHYYIKLVPVTVKMSYAGEEINALCFITVWPGKNDMFRVILAVAGKITATPLQSYIP